MNLLKTLRVIFVLTLFLTGLIHCHVEDGESKDTICRYFIDEGRGGYVVTCPAVYLKDESEHVRFTGEQVEKRTNEDVKYLEIVPPSDIRFVPSTDIFTYFVNLENLDLRDVNIHTLDYIHNCYILVYITLSHNHIKEVPHDAFFTCRELQILDLSINEISKIHENAFGQIKNLVELNLGFNQISSLSRKVLKPIKKLRKLNLRNNRLKSIPYNALNDLFDLTFLDLANNLLSTLDARFFDFVMYLESLNLSGTDIRNLTPGTFKSLKRLKYLNLSTTKLSSLHGEALSKNSELEELIINDCSIISIGEHFFDKLPKLNKVDARNNLCVDGIFTGTLNEITEKFSLCLENSRKGNRHPQNTEL